MDPTEPTAKPARPRGRPKKADAPIVPWDEVDRLLVFGEVVKDPDTDREAVKFPSLADLGARYGVSRNRVWQYASKARCYQRREEARLKAQARFEEKVVEKVAEARALATADVVQVVDDYIRGFQQAVDGGKVRFDSPADLDRLVRLKELLVGNADSRQELRGGLTLESIQQRHQRLRAQLDTLTPELEGTAIDEGAPDGERAVH
ncbi:MAG: hypothetical protein HYZ28_21075 [Myxococcales bacterium]|nr:hypothetical protein [Myxococcales bacterium]